MRATLIGHACWLLETTAGNMLTDPLFFDPFEEGTVTSCPHRQVQVEHLPPLRGIFLSHRHLDHWDFPSLAVLDRDLPVFCPPEPLLLYGMRRLGFHDLRLLEPFVPHVLDSLRLLPIPSQNRQVLEYGLVLQDTTGTLFHQVDTFVAPQDIERLHREVGRLDVHLAMYASQHFGFFESQRANTAALYAVNLRTALQLAARCVIPASAGFRFVDALQWLNAHVFPITSQQFIADLQRLHPALHTATLLPGDTLTVESLAVERQASPFVHTLVDDTERLAYDATVPIPPLVDTNPAGYGQKGLEEFASGLLEQGMLPYIRQGVHSGETVVRQYLQHGIRYQVEVIFPDTRRSWMYTFEPARGTVHLQHQAGPTSPQIRRQITASALVDWCLGRRSYFAIRTQSRRSSQVLEIVPTATGFTVQEVVLGDLLMHYILHAMSGAERRGTDWIHFATRHLVAPSGNAKGYTV